MATLLGFVRPLHLQVNMHIISQSQLAELGVLREHRGTFAVEDSLELRRPVIRQSPPSPNDAADAMSTQRTPSVPICW